MLEMKYLDTKASQEFFDFFSKNIFSQYFPKFSTPQNLKFRDLADPAICMDLADPAIGSVISPDRSNLEILDFEVSKFFENIAKN